MTVELVLSSFSDPVFFVILIQKSSDHCHFGGKLVNNFNSWAALSISQGLVNGMIVDKNETYYTHYDHKLGHLLLKASDYKNLSNLNCGINTFNHFSSHRVARSISDSNNLKKRYVELLLVNDHQEVCLLAVISYHITYYVFLVFRQ